MAHFITIVFAILITCLFAFGIISEKQRRYAHFTIYIPNALTSLGILGTFIGISIGLYHFDPRDIDNSITSLLEGMQTAFYTSLIGMSSSIFYQVLHRIFATRNQKDIPTITANNIPQEMLNVQNKQLEVLEKLTAKINNPLSMQLDMFRNDTKESLNAISKEINNQNLQNIIETIQKQQESFGDFSQTLWTKFEQFADILSKSATEQVIVALKQVIVEFNSNLTEQFGDNFKELNQAVFNLVQWQENYKTQIAQMIEQYKIGTQSIQDTSKAALKTSEAVATIQESTQIIPQNMESLTDILGIQTSQLSAYQAQIEALQKDLGAFADIRKKAVEALPYISKKVDKITTDISNSVEKTTQHYDLLQIRIGEIGEHIKENSDDFKNAVSDIINETTKTMESQIKEAMQSIKNSHTKTQKDMESQINEAMAELGGAFVGIAKKIVEEYNKLAKKQ